MNEKIYKSPDLMMVEIEIEQAILQASLVGNYPGWGEENEL